LEIIAEARHVGERGIRCHGRRPPGAFIVLAHLARALGRDFANRAGAVATAFAARLVPSTAPTRDKTRSDDRCIAPTCHDRATRHVAPHSLLPFGRQNTSFTMCLYVSIR